MPRTATAAKSERRRRKPTAPAPDPAVAELRQMLEALESLNLPSDDGEPMENDWHYAQLYVLRQSVYTLWRDRKDYYFGSNMFLYYSSEQAREIIEYVEGRTHRQPRYKGPDFFLVTGVDGTKRRDKWVVWEEGGRYPDLIIELVSPSTELKDKHKNLEFYAKVFRTPEYFWYDESKPELAGYRLKLPELEYQPIVPNEKGWLWSEVLGAYWGVWEGELTQGRRYRWLRLFDAEGNLVLLDEERLSLAQQQLAEAQQQLTEAQQRLAEAEQRAEQERQRAEAAERRIAELEAELRRLRGG
ncbi:MAG: Uma2 family endonuclease [Armatimonadota bacterium]|nr:Uma2 family endonuclease [Armatimonadota bacterium]